MTDSTPETTGFDLDLDAERRRRAAQREGQKQDQPIVFGGETIAILPVELPLDVLAPIRDMDDDITLLLRSVVRAAQTEGGTADVQALFVDLLAANPALPQNLLDTIQRIAKNLFGESGYEAFIAQRPTREDIAYLAGGIMRFYGLTLGESSPSSDSDTGAGTTSSTTSPTTSESTPDESGDAETSELVSTPTT